ncbi:hypothetical protein GCM10027347_27310 [Larkinella harenae]
MGHFLRVLRFTPLLFLVLQSALAQTIYSQNFTSGLDGWTVSNTTAFAVNATSASTGYATPIAASGGNNLSFGECGGNTEHTVTSPAISTAGRTNLMVGFGRRKTNGFGPQVVRFEFSTDGGTTWTNISSDVSSVATTNWALSVFALPAAAENQTSLLFRFRYTPPAGSACSTSFRIDDFTVSYNSALPVEFAYFRGTAESSGNRLNWETVWELGASYFVVERSPDAEVFTRIGRIDAVGKTADKQAYTFVDGEPYPGISYYRLRQVDQDGTSQLFKTIAVNRSESKVIVYENPGSGREIRLKAAGLIPASLRLMTLTGQNISFQVTEQTNNDWLIRPAIPLQPGCYLISVGQHTLRHVIQVVVR